ncbi:hypothetical protein OH77DRAFT_519855 [Trametes cingulata]|nr:hypothetical protein OH77DRAFT_519855 [Trametes cingulata]
MSAVVYQDAVTSDLPLILFHRTCLCRLSRLREAAGHSEKVSSHACGTVVGTVILPTRSAQVHACFRALVFRAGRSPYTIFNALSAMRTPFLPAALFRWRIGWGTPSAGSRRDVVGSERSLQGVLARSLRDNLAFALLVWQVAGDGRQPNRQTPPRRPSITRMPRREGHNQAFRSQWERARSYQIRGLSDKMGLGLLPSVPIKLSQGTRSATKATTPPCSHSLPSLALLCILMKEHPRASASPWLSPACRAPSKPLSRPPRLMAASMSFLPGAVSCHTGDALMKHPRPTNYLIR